MIRFLEPQWFLLLPALAAAGWFWQSLQLGRPLRMVCLGTAVLILAEPQLRRQGDGLDLWVLVDQSDSAREYAQPRLGEWETILESSKTADDRIFYVDFADEAVVRGGMLRGTTGSTEYTGSRSATRLASAVTYALGQMPDNRSARLLVITDGFSTEPLDGLVEKLTGKATPLDIRLAPDRTDTDYSVASLTLPRRVQFREGLLAEVVVRGSIDASVPVEILRDGRVIATRTAEVSGGVARLRFADRLGSPGAHRYGVRILPEVDAIRGNNTAEQWVEVQGGPRVVLVTAYADPPLAEVLKAQGFIVQVISDLAEATVGVLSGAEAVILDNVPAYRLDPDFVNGLDFFVTAQGGGLAMIGGTTSFAAGGWFGSAIDPLLPVSMELKQEHRKLAVAMAIVMDRSGSMAMTAPGTSQTKMALANEGAARAIELLGENDQVVLIPVDSAAHPLSNEPVQVGPNRSSLVAAARSVRSEGGGIFCYTGLKAAWDMLRETDVGQRHVILFADAMDAEEPGDYQQLLTEMTAAKCSVSVIGLGTEADTDAALLTDIATRGGGRVFFNANPQELPALFAMETATVARSAFIDEPVALRGTPGWAELAAEPIEWLPMVDGYNLCYLRPRASQAAVSGDEYAAPLVAFWRKGTGRVATVAFPLGGDESSLVRGWDGYGGFSQSLTRWLMGPPLPSGFGLRAGVDGSRVTVDLFYDSASAAVAEQVALDPPELTIAAGTGGTATAIAWERLAPGHFAASVEAADVPYLRGAIRIGEEAIPLGPVNVSMTPEWTFDRARRDELSALSIRSGGEPRVDFSDVWTAPRPSAFRSLRRWLIPLLLLAILLEAFQTQTGWHHALKRRTANGR
jgi:uncharacterized membrane protein